MVAGPMGHGFPHCCFRINRRSCSAPARCRFEVRRLAVIHRRRLPAAGSWPISTRRYSRDGRSWFVDCGGSHRAVPQSRTPRPTEHGGSISARAPNWIAGCCRKSLLRKIRTDNFDLQSLPRLSICDYGPCRLPRRGLAFGDQVAIAWRASRIDSSSALEWSGGIVVPADRPTPIIRCTTGSFGEPAPEKAQQGQSSPLGR